MKKLLLLLITIFIFSCATSQPSPNIRPANTYNSEKLKELKFKIATLDTKVKELDKKLDNLTKKVDKLITPDSSINEDTKTLLLSKISELSAKQENYLMFLADINKELSEIKEKLNYNDNKKNYKNRVKIIKKKIKIKEDEKFYQMCFKYFKQKQYNKSLKCYKKFTKKFKMSALIPNAYFWIGESYFKQGNFLKAIDNYDVVLTKYPKSKKVPSALLKEGLAFYYMKDKEGAKIFLQKVINEHPATPQAYYAKRFIEKFKLK